VNLELKSWVYRYTDWFAMVEVVVEATRVERCGTTEAMEMKEGRVRSSFSGCGLAAARSWELVGRYMYGHPYLLAHLTGFSAGCSVVPIDAP
jgi:hypothetical protein